MAKKYQKVHITKMMVEHYKMVNGKTREIKSQTVYEDVDSAANAIDRSMTAVKRNLSDAAWHNVWNNQVLTRIPSVSGFRDGNAEMHWWRVVCVVEVPT